MRDAHLHITGHGPIRVHTCDHFLATVGQFEVIGNGSKFAAWASMSILLGSYFANTKSCRPTRSSRAVANCASNGPMRDTHLYITGRGPIRVRTCDHFWAALGQLELIGNGSKFTAWASMSISLGSYLANIKYCRPTRSSHAVAHCASNGPMRDTRLYITVRGPIRVFMCDHFWDALGQLELIGNGVEFASWASVSISSSSHPAN
jgi:hypothetical protein